MDSGPSLAKLAKEILVIRKQLDEAIAQVGQDSQLLIALREGILKLMNWQAAWSLAIESLPIECRYEIDAILRQMHKALERRNFA